MRYPASEKAEITPAGRAIASTGQAHVGQAWCPRATFYRWSDRYREGGQRFSTGDACREGIRRRRSLAGAGADRVLCQCHGAARSS